MIAGPWSANQAMVLLDEATSALDNVTQEIVMSAVMAMPVTRIAIAHRLSTIRRADRCSSSTAVGSSKRDRRANCRPAVATSPDWPRARSSRGLSGRLRTIHSVACASSSAGRTWNGMPTPSTCPGSGRVRSHLPGSRHAAVR